MAYEDVYQAFFDESLLVLEPQIERWRDGGDWVAAADWEADREANLFIPIDQKSPIYVYERMLQCIRRLMPDSLEGLVRAMLDADGREYELGEMRRDPNGVYRRRVPLIVNYDGRRVGVVFRDDGVFLGGSNASSYDELIVVVPSSDMQLAIYGDEKRGYRRVGIRYFFETLFPGEYETFLSYLESFNESVRDLVAFSIIEQPTEMLMPRVKAKCLERLRSDIEGMREDLSRGIYLRDSQGNAIMKGIPLSGLVDELFKRFFDEGVYRAMVGTCDFADSFVSSEWMYQVNELTQTLEQTGTVVGYIKSIEQLLYDIALLYRRDATFVMKHLGKDGREEIELWDEQYAEPDKVSLFSLIDFFSEDYDIGLLKLDVPFSTVLQQILHDFRVEYRNKYLHKANLIGSEGLQKLCEVRRKAELIYLLVLGGFRISDSQLAGIGLDIGVTADDARDSIDDWLLKVVSFQSFRRDTAYADGIVVQLSTDGSHKDAARAYARDGGEYWEAVLELRDKGKSVRSTILEQPYELPFAWRQPENWMQLAGQIKSSLEKTLDDFGIKNREGTPLSVKVEFSHLDGGGIYSYTIDGPAGVVQKSKTLISVPGQCAGRQTGMPN